MCSRPGFAFNAFSNDAYLEGLATCVAEGLTQAVGVSNFNAERVRNAARVLRERGTCLSSNQVGVQGGQGEGGGAAGGRG